MIEKLKELEISAVNEICKVEDLTTLNNVKSKYLGKKSEYTNIMSNMSSLSNEEKKEVGMQSNIFRTNVNEALDKVGEVLKRKELNKRLSKDKIDMTLPSKKRITGSKHPISMVREEMEDLFYGMGYDIVTGPIVETDKYCFEMLNIPKGHPARDAQDTFYINDELLLRTQTSAMQIRYMLAKKDKKPFKMVCPGKVFRRDDDATHSHEFNQMEGLVVGENISLADLKGTLLVLAKRMFGNDREIRFRASFFPFTEPSYEVDVSCFKCNGKGCNLCKNTGWIEILGSGMVHPKVLDNCGYDSKKYTGFAFGCGLERIAMLKYGINDIKLFYNDDKRFLDNFNRKEVRNDIK